MQELSLYILDIVQNSIQSKASKITISLDWNYTYNKVQFLITDNGIGLSAKNTNIVFSPFYTTRKTRQTGFGLSFLKMDAELSNGFAKMISSAGIGTFVYAEFQMDHINRPPLGDITSTICLLLQGNPSIQLHFYLKQGSVSFKCSTQTINNMLEGLPVDNPLIMNVLHSFIATQTGFIKDMGYYMYSNKLER